MESVTPLRRLRWRTGWPLTPQLLNDEAGRLEERETTTHERLAHNGEAKGAAARAVDGSLSVALPISPQLRPVPSAAKAPSAFVRRGFAIAFAREVFIISWSAGARVAARIAGRLSSAGLSGGAAVRFAEAAPPQVARPFRFLRLPAEPKTKSPPTLRIELAGAASRKPEQLPKGLRVGPQQGKDFAPVLAIVPGQGVAVLGQTLRYGRLIRRGKPADDDQLRAFLLSDAGVKERNRIAEAANRIVLTIEKFEEIEGQVFRIAWNAANGDKPENLEMRNIVASAALAPDDTRLIPVWSKLDPPSATTLKRGERIRGAGAVKLAKPAGPFRPLVMLAGEADYGLPVTVAKEADHVASRAS